MTDALGIERLSVFGMPPVPFVELAARLGCRGIGIGLEAMRYYNPHGYPDWSLRSDPALRRDTAAALSENDVHLALVEGFDVGVGQDLDRDARDLDIIRDLGGRRINAGTLDRDRNRGFDGFARLAELARDREIELAVEIGTGPIARLPEALDAVAHVGSPGFRLLIDTMHYFRLGGSMAELAATDPATIGYVQLCDAPRERRFPSYMEEALHERMVPGDGELPLQAFLDWLPPDIFVSLEVPQRSLASTGAGPFQRLKPCVEQARAMLAASRPAT